MVDMGAYEWQGVEISEDTIQPEKIELFSYPNPFNPETAIKYSIKKDSNVLIEIYNIKGQLVKTLIDDYKYAGEHSVIWDSRDYNQQPVGSGIYFYKLIVNGKTEAVKKCLLLK
jgi:flagellar hook assembly protein FlgD